MILSPLERVLRDLEVATAALIGGEPEGRSAELKRRADAIARLQEMKETILSLGPEDFRGVTERLGRAADAGESARRDLALLSQKLTTEWSRWNQVFQSLAAAGQRQPNNVDCRG